MPRELLTPNFENVSTLFKSIYKVPVYQRPYSWDKDVVGTLLNDIFEAYRTEEGVRDYYTGNIIISGKNEKIANTYSVYNIVDGQQRLTTFTIAQLAMYVLLLEMHCPEANPTFGELKKGLWKYYNNDFDKENHAVVLNSVEKEFFAKLYNQCYKGIDAVNLLFNSESIKSVSEQRIIDNFNLIRDNIKTFVGDNLFDITNFIEFFLNHIYVICIDSEYSEKQMFGIFESLNSKGKKLEEIDLIKSYIFSQFEEEDYPDYLEKWGKLIVETDDHLYDYLYTYLRAYVYYYRVNINIGMFKNLCQDRLQEVYEVRTTRDALKHLIDDMLQYVSCYKYLSNTESAYSHLINNNEFRFYFKAFTRISYKHPKPLFFRSFVELQQNVINKNDVVHIIKEVTIFMMKFLTILGKDSKDAIPTFASIAEEVINNKSVNRSIVDNNISLALYSKGITDDKIKEQLDEMDCYETNRDLGMVLASYFEAFNNRISYDMAYELVNAYGQLYSLDHLLVQRPLSNHPKFKYYSDENNCLKLKEGHDFPNTYKDGMDYDTFLNKVLHRLGNLRIYFKDKNSARNNGVLQFKDYGEKFSSFDDIEKRSSEMVDILTKNCLKNTYIDPVNIKPVKKEKRNEMRMSEMIEYGLVHKGDNLYITNRPMDSVAKLVNSKYVEFNGEKITINKWGQMVTGWKSIQIYRHAAILGETETLDDKRKRYEQQSDM